MPGCFILQVQQRYIANNGSGMAMVFPAEEALKQLHHLAFHVQQHTEGSKPPPTSRRTKVLLRSGGVQDVDSNFFLRIFGPTSAILAWSLTTVCVDDVLPLCGDPGLANLEPSLPLPDAAAADPLDSSFDDGYNRPGTLDIDFNELVAILGL